MTNEYQTKNMTTEKLNTKELLESLDETSSELFKAVSLFDEENINTVPFKGSWTAAQVTEHVMLSNRAMIQSLEEEGRAASGNIDEGVAKLKEIFLNFDSKLQSPKFILPTQEMYNREQLIAELKDSVEQIKKLSARIDVSEMIDHRVFGEITKFEILHFVVYHTQRHIHQLNNIFQHLKNRFIN
jgi:hypothetical protein